MRYAILFLIFFCYSTKAQYSNDIIIQQALKTDTTAIGQKIVYPSFENSEVSILKIIIPPGKATGWHTHNFPVFAYVLKGTLTVEVEKGKATAFSEGTAFSEVINTLHNGSNQGKDNVVLIAFFMGEKGKPLSVHTTNDR